MVMQAGTRTIWQIDPSHTTVEFAIKHLMFSTVKGRFAGARGAIVVDEADLARSTVEAEIDAATIDTREPDRDAHLRSPDFFDLERYPTLTFRSTRVEVLGPERLRVLGDLTIRDVTREVALDTTINGRGVDPDGREITGISAEATISRRDFGLTWNVALERGGMLIGDTVKITLEIEASRQV